MLTAFQLEVANQYGYMLKDMPTDISEKSKGKLIKGYASMFMGAYLYNALYSSLTGRDSAFDPIGIVEDILKEFGFGDDDEEEKSASEKLTSITEDLVQEIPFIGGLFGGGRLPISSAIPYENPFEMATGTMTDVLDAFDEEKKEKALKDLTSEWLKPVTYLALPFGGGQISKSIKGLSMYDEDLPIAGSYTNGGDLRFTADESLGGKLKSFLFGQYASKSAQEYVDSGFKTIKKSNIEELMDLGMTSTEYRKYRAGLSKRDGTGKNGNKTMGEKLEYINSLNVSDEQKIIMIDSIASKEGEDIAPYKGGGEYEVTDNYIIAGNREYYRYTNNKGEEKWSKVKEEESETLNDLGLTISEKNTYFSLKEEISSIINEYQDDKTDLETLDSDEYKKAVEQLSSEKKKDIINKIKETGFNDEQKAYMYKKYYNSDTIDLVVTTGIDVDTYLDYSIQDIKSDKDKDGDTIPNSKKKKVIAYVNSLDLSVPEKAILIKATNSFKYNDYNKQIVEYVRNLNISYDEKVSILEELDMTVKDGRVYWK